jgi:hypothetical protein
MASSQYFQLFTRRPCCMGLCYLRLSGKQLKDLSRSWTLHCAFYSVFSYISMLIQYLRCDNAQWTVCDKWKGKVPVHTMQAYRGRGDIASLICNLIIRWRWVVSFVHWLLQPLGMGPWYLLNMRVGGPQNWSGCSGEVKNLLPLPEFKPQTVGLVA